MPCGDITEQIELTLDEHNRVASYRFSKKTCGGAIGMESLLIDDIGGKRAESIAETDINPYFRVGIDADDVEGFLKVKHFSAIQSAIRAYLGISPADAKAPCAIASITYDNSKTIIDAEINVDLLTEEIEACAHCGPR